jgi:hypothetical protein
MNYRRKDKSKELANKLLTLDIDEGIRIESSTQEKKIFINRNALGIFVVQLTTNNKANDDNNIRYFGFVNEVVQFVKSSFKKHFLIVEY